MCVCLCDCASSRFARAFVAFVCNLENISFGILVQFETANEFCDCDFVIDFKRGCICYGPQ